MAKPQASAKGRSKGLVIVESPAKARTIGRFLGSAYRVMASRGHVRDLLRSQLSVDVENDFRPRYRVPNEKRPIMKELAATAAGASVVYLATDMDREGEAIAWHLMEALGIEQDRVRRVVFHEITERAIAHSFSHPGDINMHLVDAQQARRIMDRLVGYQISPLLWARVRSRLTAGRVQSVAVRLIVEREREIEAFEPREYWSLEAELAQSTLQENGADRSFIAKLHRINGDPVELPSQAAVSPILNALERGTFQVTRVRTGKRLRKPQAPFTTSTLQQAASRQLRFGTRRTMRAVQGLYEGIDLGEQGTVGLITYPRTDSVRVSAEAQEQARGWVSRTYGENYLPDQPPSYKTRSKSPQEAHEAIRPTGVARHPEEVRANLSPDQFRLYRLIWQRFVASQMSPAVYSTQTVDIRAGSAQEGRKPYLFRASGSQLVFPGYLAVYEEEPKQDGQRLPELVEGEDLKLIRLIPKQHFTQPPAQFTEGTLVRALEEHGIGRPSTYAPTISTIQQRGYVERAERTLRPTETGTLVNDLLVEHFPDIISVGFTARMEEQLDEIAAGNRGWVPVVREFYLPFATRLAEAEKNMPEVKLGDQPIGRDCPREGCGGALVIKWGRYGKFIGCENYPECRHTEPWLERIGVACPDCGGDLVRRTTRKRRTFYGCANYPECGLTSWKLPLPTPCPACGGLLVVQRKGTARCTACANETAVDDLPGSQS